MARVYGITLDTAQDHLEEWLEAERVVTTGQSYTLGKQQLTRADLGQIRGQIQYWDGKVKELLSLQRSGSRNRAYRIVPRDL